jgi:hypothetical protein
MSLCANIEAQLGHAKLPANAGIFPGIALILFLSGVNMIQGFHRQSKEVGLIEEGALHDHLGS